MTTRTTDTIIRRLIDASIIKPTETQGLKTTEEFRKKQYHNCGSSVGDSNNKLESIINQLNSHEETADPGLIQTIIAVQKSSSRLSQEELISAGKLIYRIELSRLVCGVPPGFVLISPSEIEQFIRHHPAAVIYFWRENSAPCEAVGEKFASLQKDRNILSMFGLGAVYGPSNEDYLKKEFDVAVAPTVLFCVNGTVDSRLIGNHSRSTYVNELEILKETSNHCITTD